jgi:hypothetical protein
VEQHAHGLGAVVVVGVVLLGADLRVEVEKFFFDFFEKKSWSA